MDFCNTRLKHEKDLKIIRINKNIIFFFFVKTITISNVINKYTLAQIRPKLLKNLSRIIRVKKSINQVPSPSLLV